MIDHDVLSLLLDWVRQKHFGKYRGTVENNEDETHRGRLLVKVPAVLGDHAVWAMPCVPYAGNGVGLLTLPASGTGVWVEFEGGDPSFPVWTGFFWADDEAPEQANANIKVLKTEKGLLRIDDQEDEILVENQSQARLELTADVVAEAGQARQSIGSAGVVSEQGSGKVEVTTGAVRVNSGAMEVV
jgi:uncharacterized protein involved in type VI secretion and phage assembly